MQMYMLLLQVLSLDLTDACLLYLILVSRCLCLRHLVPSVKVGTEVYIPYLVPNRTLGIEIFSRHQKKNLAEDTRNRVDGSFQFTKKAFSPNPGGCLLLSLWTKAAGSHTTILSSILLLMSEVLQGADQRTQSQTPISLALARQRQKDGRKSEVNLVYNNAFHIQSWDS